MAEEQSLEDAVASLREQMERASSCGIRGHNMAQRVEGDLRRIINSAWLNLMEFSDGFESSTNNDGK